ncbi:3-oxoadipate enol-lactonase [Aeromicrobium sp.]|uniref:3-oxoadipate enol-lactonase n=1 Tax=Aeromicrobium sp. TaxID=1871063 RepID=UPI003C33CB83
MTSSLLFHTAEGSGDPVVMLGSLGANHRMWDPQVPALARDHAVIRVDLRGHGDSPVAPGPCTMADLAEDVVEVLDARGLESVHVVGLSLGGMVGLQMAVDHPQRVRSLAVLCTSAQLGPREGWLDRAALVRAHGTTAVASAVVGRWLTPGYAAAHPDETDAFQRMVTDTPAEGYASACEAIADHDLVAELPRVAAPTLAVAGRDDPATGPDHLHQIADTVPDADYLEVAPAAHLASWERSTEVNAALRTHLAKARSEP